MISLEPWPLVSVLLTSPAWSATVGDGGDEENVISGWGLTVFAGVCSLLATIISWWHVLMHLRNYSEPRFQRNIVRIIFMVPVYSAASFMAILFPDNSVYFNTLREWYEAWVIYSFLALLVEWVGGHDLTEDKICEDTVEPSIILCTCCIPPLRVTRDYLYRCREGGHQVVWVKGFLSTVSLVLFACGLYKDGNFSPSSSYLYITIIYFLSYTVAVYSLLFLYFGCEHLLHPYRPVPKFAMVKAVIFFTYLEGLAVYLLQLLNWLPTPLGAEEFQNVLICCEMLFAAFGFVYAFPHRPYMEGAKGRETTLFEGLQEAVLAHDFIEEAKAIFVQEAEKVKEQATHLTIHVNTLFERSRLQCKDDALQQQCSHSGSEQSKLHTNSAPL